jgi:zinc protease
MKHIFVRTMLLTAAIVTLALSSMAQKVDKLKFPVLNPIPKPNVAKLTLDNGIRLYLLEDHSLPIFKVSARINTGSYLEPADKVGLAGICGEVMRSGGTSKWTGDEIDQKLEDVGGSVETSIELASGSASVNVLSEYTDLGLEVLAEVLRRPVFEDDKVELTRVAHRSAIARRNDDPMEIGRREFRKVIYGAESPYARHTEYSTIGAITKDDLVQFHQMWVRPQNIQMAIIGDFNTAEIITKIKQYFGDWPKEGAPVPPLPEVQYNFDNRVFYAEKGDVNQSNCFIGHIGGLVTDPDYAERIVMNSILGGSFDSRLNNAVRSREGLAYAVFGVYSANIKYPGLFYNFVSTKSETTVKAVKGVIAEITRMQIDIPTPVEMRKAKEGYLNSFVFNFDSKAEILGRLMNYDFYGLPEDFLYKEKDMIEKVTADGVMAAAKKNLRPDALRVLVVGKQADFEMPLDQANLGPVTPVDIAIPSPVVKRELTITDETLMQGKALLDKVVIAQGGLKALKKVNSISMAGTLTLSMQGREMPLEVNGIEVFPDKGRQVITFMGQKMYSIRNGVAGWQTNPQTGQVDAMSEEDLKGDSEDRSRNTIFLLKQADKPSYRAVFDGTGDHDGTALSYIAIIDDNSKLICRFGVNAANMIVTKTYEGETPVGPGMVTEIASDIQVVNGVKVPMAEKHLLDGQPYASLKITTYTINGVVPPTSFDKP